MNKAILIIFSVILLAPIGYQDVLAQPFSEIRIGDVDGFGYGTGAGFLAANGGAANVGVGGVLGAEMLPTVGDFLPDLNTNGVLATGAGDDFDNRLNEMITGVGFTDIATTGEEFTDIALSTSYDTSSNNNNVFDANTNSFGAGGPFPGDGNPNTLSNQPGFVFDFFVASGDIVSGTPVFFNFIFGDYDVTPAEIRFERADGTTFTQMVSPQGGGQDGSIQVAFAALDFNDVFTPSVGGFDGFLIVDFVAPNEPYTAFDYVEISVTPAAPNEVIGGTILDIDNYSLFIATIENTSLLLAGAQTNLFWVISAIAIVAGASILIKRKNE